MWNMDKLQFIWRKSFRTLYNKRFLDFILRRCAFVERWHSYAGSDAVGSSVSSRLLSWQSSQPNFAPQESGSVSYSRSTWLCDSFCFCLTYAQKKRHQTAIVYSPTPQIGDPQKLPLQITAKRWQIEQNVVHWDVLASRLWASFGTNPNALALP